MHSKIFLRNRKAQEYTETGTVGRSLLIGGILVLAIVGVMLRSSKIHAAEAGQDTVASFTEFAKELFEVANGTKDYAVVSRMSIKDDYVIAVFSEGASGKALADTCQRNEYFERPDDECGNFMCACICSEDDSCKNPYDCEIIEGKIGAVYADPDFDANLGGKRVPEGHDVIIYGDCDGWGGEPLRVRSILIENKGNSILISDNACGNPGKGFGCYNKECSKMGGFTRELPEYKCPDKRNPFCCI
jgi:hypothetical protein